MSCALALGTFDGVHIGHKKVLCGATKAGTAFAVAFSVPPKCYFGSENIIITDSKTKENLILETGINRVDFIDFKKVRNLTPKEFFDYIYNQYKPTVISCGFNYRFGCNASGDIDTLDGFCGEKGIKLKICESVKVNDESVSSSAIRGYIANGEIEKANAMLGRNYFVTSSVLHGKELGKQLGFPTVNQELFKNSVLPRFGVYASFVTIDNVRYKAITNIGKNPTVNGEKVTVESNISGFEGNVYGKTVTTELVSFIRKERAFESLNELKKAIQDDVAFRNNLKD